MEVLDLEREPGAPALILRFGSLVAATRICGSASTFEASLAISFPSVSVAPLQRLLLRGTLVSVDSTSDMLGM